MAKIKGFELKSIRHFKGHEGEDCIDANMYLNGKKIGHYRDDYMMGPEDVEYVSKEVEDQMMNVIVAYAKEHPDEYIVNLYRQPERKKQFEKECEWFRNRYPHIPEKDITMETMSANSVIFIVRDLLIVLDWEKIFKKSVKQGYRAIGIQDWRGTNYFKYPASMSDEVLTADIENNNLILITDLSDFIFD